MCCPKHQCSITVEALMTAQTISLPEVNRIRDSRVTGIQVHFNFPNVGADSISYSPTDRQLFANEYLQSTYLTLVNSNGTEIVSKMNMAHLQRGPYCPEPLAVDWTNIDLTQSSITMAATQWADLGSIGQSIMIEFFLDCNACGVSQQ